MEQNAATLLVSGIQDISAFLPIIGTEQCERHVGEALTGGFLYAAATPMSLFGCLGIVKASITILCASLSSRLARMLADAGFKIQGSTAAMIGIALEDPSHGPSTAKETDQEFLAGRKFLKLLQEQHIDKSQVDLKFTYYRWNCWLCFATASLACLGVAPYIPIIAQDDPPALPIPAWGFPLIRIMGSALSVVVAQMIIQIRMQEIILPLQFVSY
ncbi:hypothetical protein C8R43DRAFT_870137 [Mycena crocata]|nr:hypothetical protein C8R43DRAFT_870137 [Mycena crocata]